MERLSRRHPNLQPSADTSTNQQALQLLQAADIMDKYLKASIIHFTLAAILAYLLFGCASQQFYKGACRNECIQVATILVERYPGRTFVATGPTMHNPKFWHCQAFVRSEDKLTDTYYRLWIDKAVESPMDHWFKPKRELTPKEFFESNRKWR